MRTRILAAALIAGGVIVTCGQASAQPRYLRSSYNVTRYNPVQYRYAFPAAPAVYGYQPAGPGYAAPYPYQGVSPYQASGGPAFIRSLYLQVLNREPDPNGLQVWLNILAQSGGDANAVSAQFVQAAQAEINMRNATARPAYYP